MKPLVVCSYLFKKVPRLSCHDTSCPLLIIFSAIPLTDIFSPSSTSNNSCGHGTVNNDHDSASSSYSDHIATAIDIIDQSHSNLDNSFDDETTVKEVQIEIIANGNINLKKGDILFVNCDIDSRSTSVINQQLVIPTNKQKKQSRARRDCPIKGCTAINLLKLSNHLRQKHGLKNPSTIKKYLKQAKLVCVIIMILICLCVLLIYNRKTKELGTQETSNIKTRPAQLMHHLAKVIYYLRRFVVSYIQLFVV